MNLDDCIITCFCLIDEMLPVATKGKRLFQRGPLPKLADSGVITMEIVGTYLGLSQDQEVFDYFRRHYAQLFLQSARSSSLSSIGSLSRLAKLAHCVSYVLKAFNNCAIIPVWKY